MAAAGETATRGTARRAAEDQARPPAAAPGYGPLLRRYLAGQSGAVAGMLLLLLLGIGLQLAGPQLVRRFIDAVGAGAPEATLLRTAALFLAITVAQQAATVLAAYTSERVAWTATNALRADLAAHVLGLDLGFHKARTPGELIERVDGDVDALAGFFSSFVVELLGSALFLAGVLVALFLVDVRVGAAFAVFAALAVLLLGWVRRFGTPYWLADRAQSAAFYGYLGEALAAREDLRANGAVAYALRRFLLHLRDWRPIALRAAFWGQSVMTAAILAFAVGDALAYGLGGRLYGLGDLSLGAVYLVVAYVAMLAQPIERIRVQLQDLQRADAAIARVRALLATRSRLADGAADLPDGPLAVEFRDVRFWYEDGASPERDAPAGEAALDGVSFRLEAGRVLGLLGRTGSGKTTIARLLFRLYDPQAGGVHLGGVDVRRARLAALRPCVGLVTQDVQLFAASLRDNLTLFDPAVPDARLLAALDALGLRPWLDRLPGGLDTPISAAVLSAGEAQMLALARLWLREPDLVILDEASSRLDPATEALLDRALDRLLAGRTALIIAHRLATVERADDILILEAGRVVEHRPRAALAADPRSRFAALHRTGLGEVLA